MEAKEIKALEYGFKLDGAETATYQADDNGTPVTRMYFRLPMVAESGNEGGKSQSGKLLIISRFERTENFFPGTVVYNMLIEHFKADGNKLGDKCKAWLESTAMLGAFVTVPSRPHVYIKKDGTKSRVYTRLTQFCTTEEIPTAQFDIINNLNTQVQAGKAEFTDGQGAVVTNTAQQSNEIQL